MLLKGELLKELIGYLRQEKEMTSHELFKKWTSMQIYFCDPYTPLQRGKNENTKMLIQGFFRRGTDLNQYTRNQIKRVQNLLNERP